MKNISEETFHTWTLILATLTGVAIFAVALVFVNPRIPYNPFKPPLAVSPTSATLAAAKAALPPTWTPTLTTTPTETPTLTPTFTNTPTLTPTLTHTPTLLPTTTVRPPTRTVAPLQASSSSAPPPSNQYRPVLLSCTHSGGVYIKGKVSSGGSPQEGVRVRIATSPDAATVIEEQMTRNGGDGNASFDFVLKAIGNFDGQSVWYLWLVDAVGNPISDPKFHVTTNALPPDSPDACWLAIVDFVR